MQLEKVAEAKKNKVRMNVEFILHHDICSGVTVESNRLFRTYKDAEKEHGAAYIVAIGGAR